jgi:hypothetical protein
MARLVLLACTLFGLAAMHTVGHGAVTQSPPRTVAARSPVASVVAVVTGVGEDRDDCGGDECAHRAAPPGDTRGGPWWWEVCTAVLTGVAGAALLAALLVALPTRRTSPSPPAERRRHRSGGGRAVPFGLAVTVVAVART